MEVLFMSIQNIHYWSAPEAGNSLPISPDTDKKEAATFFENYSHSFDSALFDLFTNSKMNSGALYSNSFFGYDLNSPSQLREASEKAKSMGMEKVLAAQLSSPLPFYDSNNRSRESYNSSSGLNSIGNLTIQLMLAKAQNVFDNIKKNETMSLPAYIKNISESKTDKTENFSDPGGIESTLSDAIENLRNQMAQTSEKFDLPFSELIRIVEKSE